MARLAVPLPYSWELSAERFRVLGHDPATVWNGGALHRVFGGREVVLRTRVGSGLEVRPDDAADDPALRHFLGLSFDLGAFRAFAARDAVLAPLERRLRGYRPVLMPDPWEMLVGSITAQQVSLAAATAIRGRFVERFGVRHDRAWAFPTRTLVATLDPSDLVALGFSLRKAEYVVGVARSALDLEGLAPLSDSEVAARIRAERGLGEWTADWFLARHLGRGRAWPAGDLALRKAVSASYTGDRVLSIDEVRAVGRRFGEFANLAAHYLLLGGRTP